MQPPSASPAPPAFAGGLWSPLDELASTAWSAEEVEKYIVAVAAAQRNGHAARALELAKVPTDIKSIVSTLAGNRWSAKAALAAAGVSDKKQEKWVEAAAAVEAGQPREDVMATLGVPLELRSAVSKLAGAKGNQNSRVTSATSPEGVLPKDEKMAIELSGITGYSVSKETRMHYTEVLQKNNAFGYYRVSFIDAHTGEEVTILDLWDKRVTGKRKRLGKKTVNVLHGL